MKAASLSFYQHRSNHQLELNELTELKKKSEEALSDILENYCLEDAALSSLSEIEVSLVDNQKISELHDQYLNDPSPTDVITFDHGEIFVSLETAFQVAPAQKEPFQREVLRYVVHGILHLAGYLDEKPQDHEKMHCLQEQIVLSLDGHI